MKPAKKGEGNVGLKNDKGEATNLRLTGQFSWHVIQKIDFAAEFSDEEKNDVDRGGLIGRLGLVRE